ncbi:hypothetical protein SLUN_00445 [Streptomyces lunaelactis]|uniref:BioF2-like acetyltransferase domain-containing protein n=1 Tax=Streptomyces lunaelactis TaxID=1535768 RepID=A0A2R4SVR2_9ACTN|nr:GNAT family N-acetyltransferase [Streptomyces lunaelactis]AVZ70960.1 hypothetical protein SLUN_00445 [Streptomyces lunaelactis]NUK27802.1 GNAT family N-acetyltransferase [Streptomyces lunaelactis]NUK88342.1 GNAT family N-acetyltransferase [Streptomyces lunaelactis]
MTKSVADALMRGPGGLTPLPSASSVTVDVLEGPGAKDFLISQWAALYDQTPMATPYQSPVWLAAHADLLPPTAVLQILVASSGAGPRAALALVQDRGLVGRMEVQPLSAPDAEYIRLVGPDAEQPAVAAVIAESLTGLNADVMLPDVPADSALGRYIAQWQHTLTRCARIQLPVDYTAMSRSTRREHKRRTRDWNDLAADGHTVTYRRTSCATELLDAYADLAQLHQLRWRGTGPGDRLTSADERFRSVLERCAAMAFIATLAIGEDVVAAQLCLHRGRHAYSLLPAMNPALQDLAPGHALLRRLTADLAAAGYTALDLGRTSSAPGQLAYKSQYAPTWTATLTAAQPSTAGSALTAQKGIA